MFEGVSLLNTRVFAIDDLVFRMYVGINSDECNKGDDSSSLIYTSLSAAGYKMEAVLHLKPQTSITSIIIPGVIPAKRSSTLSKTPFTIAEVACVSTHRRESDVPELFA